MLKMCRLLALCLFVFYMLITCHAHAFDIYVVSFVSYSYSDIYVMSLATLANALRKARELRRLNDASIAGGIHIILAAGTYTLYEPVFIRPEDAGTIASPTYIEAMPGAKPVLSGGFNIGKFSRSTRAI